MKALLKRALGAFLSVVVFSTMLVIPQMPVAAMNECTTSIVSGFPKGAWQNEITFPDWNSTVDDSLAMNSMYSFTGFSGQGELYVQASGDLTSMELFVNGTKVDVSDILSHPGDVVKVNYASVAEDGTNTIQVTNIMPSTAQVHVKIPYATVIQGTPADVGMNEDTLAMIDDLINSEIKYGFSAAQLAVIKDGKMVVDEAWGNLNGWTEDGQIDKTSPPVTTDTLFDLASNSKMYATNYAVQKLVTDGVLNLDEKISHYIPEFQDQPGDVITGKSDLTVRQILQHQAGFPADPQYHNNNSAYIQAHPDLYCQNREDMLDTIIRTPLEYVPGTQTVYSDVDYMLLGLLIEQVTGMREDEYLKTNIYDPMGLTHTTYNPLENGFTKDDCAATELNGNTRGGAVSFNNVRTDTIQGEVHDEKAYYCMDGVSGHAGLFSNAEELATLCQVMLNGGGYGNNRFFSKDVIDEFTKPKSIDNPNWGLGWWREADNSSRMYYFGPQSSSNTYGHQGWTGTITVIDPESNLVIVLLTNKKNSPVIDPAVDANDFVCDNFTLGTLGSISGYVYEALNTHNSQATDANIFTMATEKLKLLAEHYGSYDETAQLADACALADTAVSRALERQTTEMVSYAQTVVSELSEAVNNGVTKQESKNLGAAAIQDLQNRLSSILPVSADVPTPSSPTDIALNTDHSNLKTEIKDTSQISVTPVSATPSGADAQVSLAYPSQNQTAGDMQTSHLFSSSVFTFKGYQNQGIAYVTVLDANKAADMRIFINGQEVDTSQMLANPTTTFAVDFSKVAVNDRNTIQVSGMPLSTKPQEAVTVQIPNPVVQAGTPESVGISSDTLNSIDDLINNDIENGFSAAQLAIVKDGVMVKNSGYGTVNAYYQDGTPKMDSPAVTTDTLFDIASNTKMYSTNLAVEKLVSEGKLDINQKISYYIPDFKDQPGDAIQGKSDMTVKEVLEHQAGFPADPQYHNNNSAYVQENGLYCQERDEMLSMIIKTPLEYQPGTQTKYSDVDYMLLGFLVEAITGQRLDEYVEQNIYHPMGLDHLLYNPLEKGFTPDQCAATELNGNTRDGQVTFNNIRTDTLQGQVHDEKAYYCMDGVSGHAGLFATAGDLATLAQTVLNDGGYGNTQVFSKNVGEIFTSPKNTSSTWGLGWWRQGDMGRPWYFSVEASRGTVGHQGWTGTLTVVDPVENLVIVLLTNKINSPITSKGGDDFSGNYYTTASLGAIISLVYQSINSSNPESIDALLADMFNEKMKLVAEEGANSAQDPIVSSAYALLDTLLDRAQRRQTPQTLDYAQDAERLLNFERDYEKINQVNERIIALGGEPYLPSPTPSPEPDPDNYPSSGGDGTDSQDISGNGEAESDVLVTPKDASTPVTGDGFSLIGAMGLFALSIGTVCVTRRIGRKRK